MRRLHKQRFAQSASHRTRGSALVPVIAAVLILLLSGIALAELFSAQRMQSVLAVESTQAFWIAEAGIWHAAHEGTELTTPVSFGSGTYTVAQSGDQYTGTSIKNNASRVVTLTLTSSSGGAISSSPIAHWNLNETSGTTAADSAGSNDGTLTNGVALGSTGAPSGGTAATFDGSNDYIEVPHSSAYLLDDGTIQLWFRADDVSGTQTLFSKDSSGYDSGGHFTIKLNGDDVEVRMQSTSSTYTLDSGSVVTAGTWHHVALTFGSAGLKLYVDASLEDTNSYTGGTGTTSGGSGNAEPIAIGAETWSSGNGVVTPLQYYFDGRIDAVAVYATALSAADIQALYDAGGAIS